MKASSFAYARPQSLGEALALQLEQQVRREGVGERLERPGRQLLGEQLDKQRRRHRYARPRSIGNPSRSRDS